MNTTRQHFGAQPAFEIDQLMILVKINIFSIGAVADLRRAARLSCGYGFNRSQHGLQRSGHRQPALVMGGRGPRAQYIGLCHSRFARKERRGAACCSQPNRAVGRRRTAWQAASTTRARATLSTRLAGAPGLEPGNGGIKIRCLTAWLRPTKGPARSAERPHHSHCAAWQQSRQARRNAASRTACPHHVRPL